MKQSNIRSAIHWVKENTELGALFVFALSIAGFWAFAELADEVVEGSTRDLDRDILLLLRVNEDTSNPIGPEWVEEIMRDLTAAGGVALLTLATLAVTIFFLLQKKRGMALYLLVAVGGGLLISGVTKEFFGRPRPELVPHGSIVHTASFPSGHSMMAAVVYLTLGALIAKTLSERRLKTFVLTLAILTTLLVGISRVYLGVHWPTDVLAGWLAGFFWATSCILFMRYFGRRAARDLPASERPPS